MEIEISGISSEGKQTTAKGWRKNAGGKKPMTDKEVEKECSAFFKKMQGRVEAIALTVAGDSGQGMHFSGGRTVLIMSLLEDLARSLVMQMKKD